MSLDNIFALATLPKSIGPNPPSDSEFVRFEPFRALNDPFRCLPDDGRPLDGFTYVPLNSNFVSSIFSTFDDSLVFLALSSICSSFAILFAIFFAETTLATGAELVALLHKYKILVDLS